MTDDFEVQISELNTKLKLGEQIISSLEEKLRETPKLVSPQIQPPKFDESVDPDVGSTIKLIKEDYESRIALLETRLAVQKEAHVTAMDDLRQYLKESHKTEIELVV